MKFTLRKFIVGLLSVGILLGIFTLYNRLGGNRPEEIDLGREFKDTIPDSNVDNTSGQEGTIADTKIVTVRQTRFLHRNRNNEVDREFGFHELLHESGDRWEIEKPYMNMFSPNLTCSITADKGNVQVETAFGQPSPTDATFSGNVVIHVTPTEPNSVKESLIYLDDVVFVSRKSLLLSSGSVKFINESAKLTGRGLELAYDEESGRLALFRINDLQSLKLRSSGLDLFSGRTPKIPQGNAQPQDILAAKVKERRASGRLDDEKTGEYYGCVFFKNVVLKTPAQVIVAEEELSIRDVFWPALAGSQNKTSSQRSTESTDFSQQDIRRSPARAASAGDKLLSLSDDLFDIIITCDGGAVVAPVESLSIENRPGNTGDMNRKSQVKAEADDPNRTFFIARKIDYSASTQDATGLGPVKLTFCADMNNIGDEKSTGSAPRVTVTADNQARLLNSSNQIIFDGNCVCTMLRAEPNTVLEYRISSPELVLDIIPTTNAAAALSSANLLHVTAQGGAFQLTAVRKSAQQVIGGIQLEGSKLEYDVCEKLLIAAGPGSIKLNNPGGPDAGRAGFSLSRPCYAFLRNFDTLQYFLESGRLVAEAASRQILLDYFPITNGRYGPHARAVVGHIEAQFTQAGERNTELVSINASRGITYEDDTNQFVGGTLVYDNEKSAVNITGDTEQPGYFNGTLVDSIEVDLKTGKAKATIPAPSVLQFNK